MSSLKDFCNTQPGGKFYKTAGQNVNLVPVYSYSQIKDTTKLKEIKTQFKTNDDSAEYIDSLIKSMKIPTDFDLILAPTSSSKMLSYFASAVAREYNVPMIRDAFIKSLPTEITFSTGDVVLDEDTLVSMLNIIKLAKASGVFELKKVKPIQFRKFFTNLMKFNTDVSAIADKRILLVDDIITSGSTMNDMFKILMRYGATNVTGLTIMKRQ